MDNSASDDVTSSGALWRHARSHGYAARLKDLQQRRALATAWAIALDYLLIGAAMLVTFNLGWLALLPALLLIGNRQRALVVLIHDASHRLLCNSGKANDRIAKWLLCPPMLISLSRYRTLHLQHHQHLGDPQKDTDYLHDEALIAQGWWATYRTQLLGRSNLFTACFGMLARMTPGERLTTATWWALALAGVTTAWGVQGLGLFVALWVTARIGVYHPIISFVIISDHVGLVPGTVVSFTRNHPGNLASRFIHPHNNGWHLAHHLMPGLPFHALRSAHGVLMQWPPYRDAEHCEKYFSGPQSVVASWCRKSRRWTLPALDLLSRR